MRCMQHPDREVYARGRCESCYRSIIRRLKKEGADVSVAVKRKLLLPHKSNWRWKQRQPKASE